MTATSELFCDEVVRDKAEELFGKRIPEYDHIEIQDIWKGIYQESCFPNAGKITYVDEQKTPLATVSFRVKFNIAGEGKDRHIEVVEPYELDLQMVSKKPPTDKEVSNMLKNDLVTVYFVEKFDTEKKRYIGNLDDFDLILFEDLFSWDKNKNTGTLDKDVVYLEPNDEHSEWMILKFPEYILEEIKERIETLAKKYLISWKVLGREGK